MALAYIGSARVGECGRKGRRERKSDIIKRKDMKKRKRVVRAYGKSCRN